MNIENKNYPDLDEIKKLKSITDLYSYNIRPEKEAGKLIIDKIYFKDYILYSLSAIVCQKDNLAKYKKITEYTKELRQLYKIIYEHVKERSSDAKIDERFIKYIKSMPKVKVH